LEGDLLWNAGRTSAEYLERNAETLVKGKDILEIGAAAGVPSIVCAVKGARTVVMTDYPDPDLVDNMRQNAAAAMPLIPAESHLHVTGYKWGADTAEITSFLSLEAVPPAAARFDVLIMADVVYSHREHPNLILTMQRALKRTADAVALVIFTPYQPWLLPKTEKFFPLAEESGFTVIKIFEKAMDTVLFKDDPGVCPHCCDDERDAPADEMIERRTRNSAGQSLDMSCVGRQMSCDIGATLTRQKSLTVEAVYQAEIPSLIRTSAIVSRQTR
jgi:nicotinamide N-methyltransferase